MKSEISLKRTLYRTFSILILFLVVCFIYKSYLHPVAGVSILTILANEKSSSYLTIGLIQDLLFFIFVFISIHLCWAYVITVSCRKFFKKFNDNKLKTLFWLAIVLLHINFLLLANSHLYPTSLLSIYRVSFLNNIFILSILSIAIIYLFICGLLEQKQWGVIFTSIFLSVFLFLPPSFKISDLKEGDINSPNIILIGLDALRPDHLLYRNELADNLLPNINKFLAHSTVYDKSYTTQPRTFVSWLSLLKSQYPNKHGGRFNLTSADKLDKNIPLIGALKEKGYTSIYAIDERRFNQIDKSYGFDKVIGPKIGFADQLINRVSDIPILNVLSQRRFGQYLLPFMFLNRANGMTYDPELFNSAALSSLNPETPNLFAIHFCMLHWPYTAKDFIEIDNQKWQGNYNHFMYLSLLGKLDQQFSHLIKNLKEHGYLDNAIVYVFSDHGDGFKLDKDLIPPANNEFDSLPIKLNSWGHATNVLDQTQANILLSKSSFKNGKHLNTGKVVSGNFSIIDIVPTIHHDMAIPSNKNYQGILLPSSSPSAKKTRFLFVNSAKPTSSLNVSFINKDEVIKENIEIYSVDSSGRMVMNQNSYADIISKQHRSVYFQDWQLAYIPDYAGFIGIDLSKNNWQPINNFNENFPWKIMLEQFCDHYLAEDKNLNIKKCDSLN